MSSSSPPTPLSQSTSFYSAPDGEDNSTAASSPVHTHLFPYRSARPLPRELRQHCQIFLEEQLCTADELDVAVQALAYLRGVVSVVGPVKADIRTAVQFRRWSRRSGHRGHGNDSQPSDHSDDSDQGNHAGDEDRLSGRLANDSSLWSRGQDFWSVLGWAMNCSVLHPRRWTYWKAWLDLMLDAMDKDWEERERLDAEAHQAAGTTGDVPVTARRESIVTMYLDQQTGRRGSFKAVIKALLADGGPISSAAFREVFDKETRGPKRKKPSSSSSSRKRKRETLDLENDEFGDYLVDDEDECASSGQSEPSTPQKKRGPDERTAATGPGDDDAEQVGLDHPGLVESVWVRLRLFRLVSLATHTMGRRGELDDLYSDLASALKLAPLPLFSLIVSQRSNPLPPEAHVTLLKELFALLLPASHRKPARVDPDAEDAGAITPPMLRECFAPYPANTVAADDNAKLSLVTESAVQLLWRCGAVEYTELLGQAIERGIEAREAKTKKKRSATKARMDPGDILAHEVLSSSSERLRLLLEVMKATATTAVD
ncbi:hypothetical protein GMORB2_5942 [Geosmithia morbida]|uniref:Uncharacterized protein n=1 Tax=Geosmithia morbida TaxID=1094350 RepID=A0A9P4YYS2_9HYPO|nr:uncharacterized protein GMORB2_5942 [Geosmithia morbida]KAF4124226.1 hypothetical protein GMORB2_5942 [Geosmithia morbida]